MSLGPSFWTQARAPPAPASWAWSGSKTAEETKTVSVHYHRTMAGLLAPNSLAALPASLLLWNIASKNASSLSSITTVSSHALADSAWIGRASQSCEVPGRSPRTFRMPVKCTGAKLRVQDKTPAKTGPEIITDSLNSDCERALGHSE